MPTSGTAIKLPARYWVSRDEDSVKGLSDLVEFWSARPMCVRTLEEGAQWFGGDSDTTGFATRIMIMRVDVARKLHTVPDTSLELVCVGSEP